MHTTELTKQNTASRIHDPRTCLNLCFHKIYRHHVRYFSMWIMSHRQNQLKWKIRRDTDRSRLLCRPPFSLENQHTTEPRCSVVCVYAARLCASRLGGVEGHPWLKELVFLLSRCQWRLFLRVIIVNRSALVHAIAWQRTGGKPLHEPMMAQIAAAVWRHQTTMWLSESIYTRNNP